MTTTTTEPPGLTVPYPPAVGPLRVCRVTLPSEPADPQHGYLVDTAIAELTRTGYYVAVVEGDDIWPWRRLTKVVRDRLGTEVSAGSTRAIGGRLSVMRLHPNTPFHNALTTRQVDPDLVGAVARARHERDQAAAEAAREAEIEASPNISTCAEGVHTHACQRLSCCLAKCDLTTRELDAFLAGTFESDVDGICMWIEEALGRSDFWDPRDPLIILRELLELVPTPGQAQTTRTGHHGRLRSLCAQHQSAYPDVLIAIDDAWGEWDIVRSGDVVSELRRRIRAELGPGF